MIVIRFLDYIFKKKSLLSRKENEYYLYDNKLSYKERYALYKLLKRSELDHLIKIEGVLKRWSFKACKTVIKNLFIVPFRKPFIYLYWYFRDQYVERMNRKTCTYGAHPVPKTIECLIDDYKEFTKNPDVWGGYTYVQQVVEERDPVTNKLKELRVNHKYKGSANFFHTTGLSGPDKKIDLISEFALSIFDETPMLDGGYYYMMDQTEYNEEVYYELICVDEMFEYDGMRHIVFEDAYMYDMNLRRRAKIELINSGKLDYWSQDFVEKGYDEYDADLIDWNALDTYEGDEDEEDCEAHYNDNPTSEVERDHLYTAINYVYYPMCEKFHKREKKYSPKSWFNIWFPIVLRTFCFVTWPFVIYSFAEDCFEYIVFDYSDKYVWREGYFMDDMLHEYDEIVKEYGKYGSILYFVGWAIAIYCAFEFGYSN